MLGGRIHGFIFVPAVAGIYPINIVTTGNTNILLGLLNINAIEICDKTKIGKRIFCLIQELESRAYPLIELFCCGFSVTSQYKIINLSQHIDCFIIMDLGVDGFVVSS